VSIATLFAEALQRNMANGSFGTSATRKGREVQFRCTLLMKIDVCNWLLWSVSKAIELRWASRVLDLPTDPPLSFV
jgi:hypothetical protein